MGDAAPTVLIADAGTDTRHALRRALEAAGFAVTEASSGTEAIAALSQGWFDAVVTELWMPGADGIAVLQSIRRIAAEIAIFVVTGGGPGLSIASAATLAEVWGARRVYVRPVDLADLVSEIAALFPPR